jgi:glycerophosphoryl diester phosphodiesterase
LHPLAIAHRAGNSLAGLHAANSLGADVIECDVHEHRGQLELRHLKTAGPLPFLWDRWELASASAPRLGLLELLEADRHATLFMLDLKGRRTSAARAVADLLYESGRDRPVMVCGRHWPSVDVLADLPFVLPILSARNRLELSQLRERVRRSPVHGVSVHRSLLTSEIVTELRASVELVMTWPINDLDLLQSTLAIGANGVISDEPTVLQALLSSR